MPARLSLQLIAQIREMRRTMSLAAIHRATGASIRSIREYTDDVELAPCQCGRRFNHAGRCAPRHTANAAMQEDTARWLAGRRHWTIEADALLRQLWESDVEEDEIAAQIRRLLDRDDVTAAAVKVRAYRLGYHRSREYTRRSRAESALRRWHGTDAARLEEARARRALPLPATTPRNRLRMPSADAQVIWHDMSISGEVAAERIGLTARWLYRRFGPRVPLPPSPPPRRAGGFSMAAMSIPDPIIALRLAAAAQQSRGSLMPVMGRISQSPDGAG